MFTQLIIDKRIELTLSSDNAIYLWFDIKHPLSATPKKGRSYLQIATIKGIAIMADSELFKSIRKLDDHPKVIDLCLFDSFDQHWSFSFIFPDTISLDCVWVGCSSQ